MIHYVFKFENIAMETENKNEYVSEDQECLRLLTSNGTDAKRAANRSFARWRHFYTTSITFVFSFHIQV